MTVSCYLSFWTSLGVCGTSYMAVSAGGTRVCVLACVRKCMEIGGWLLPLGISVRNASHGQELHTLWLCVAPAMNALTGNFYMATNMERCVSTSQQLQLLCACLDRTPHAATTCVCPHLEPPGSPCAFFKRVG